MFLDKKEFNNFKSVNLKFNLLIVVSFFVIKKILKSLT